MCTNNQTPPANEREMQDRRRNALEATAREAEKRSRRGLF